MILATFGLLARPRSILLLSESVRQRKILHNPALVLPTAVAVDHHQNLWVAQSYFNATNGLFEFSPSGSTMPCGSTCGPFVGGGISNPVALAVDAEGNLWVRNDNGVLSEFSSAGTPISPAAGYQGLGIADTSTPYVSSGVYQMAFDPSGALWIPNELGNNVVKITPAHTPGANPSSVTVSGGGLDRPYGLVIDPAGSVWVGSGTGNMLTKFNNDGSVAIPAFPISSDCSLNWMTVDGAGTLWISSAGTTPGSVCAVASSGSILIQSSADTYTGGDGAGSHVMADASGSLWEETGGLFYTGAIQYLGAAVPARVSVGVKMRDQVKQDGR